jgi:DNA-binding transcriptional LysR family regulator
MRSPTNVAHAFSRIRFKHLQIVDAITHYGSVHAAARGLNMTQPAISKILRDLEDQLGVELFERLPRGVRPTAIGLEVVAYARRTLSETTRFFDAVASLRQGGYGSLSIGAVMSAVADLLPDALAALRERRPRMTVHILTGTSDELLAALERRSIEVAIGRPTEPRHHAIFNYEPLFEETVSAFCAPDHPLAGRDKITAADLVGETWVLQASTSPLRQILESSLAHLGCPPRTAAIETASIFATVNLVRRARMLSILPRNVIASWVSHGEIVELPLPLNERLADCGLVTRRDEPLGPNALELVDLIRVCWQRSTPEANSRL